MFIEEFLQTVATEYSLSFSELKELFLSEFDHDLYFHYAYFEFSIFDEFQKFVKELGIATCASVVFYMRHFELQRKIASLKKRNREKVKRICELFFDKNDEIMKNLL